MANPGLTFKNATANTVYLALCTADSSCGPTDQWRKHGWYAIAPNASLTVIGNDLRTVNRYLAWFADDWAGGPSWNGPGNRDYLVTNNAFNQCYDNNSGCNVRYEFQQLDLNGSYGMIVTLTAPGKFSVDGYGPPAPPPPPADDGDGDGWGDDGDDDGDDGDDGGDGGDGGGDE